MSAVIAVVSRNSNGMGIIRTKNIIMRFVLREIGGIGEYITCLGTIKAVNCIIENVQPGDTDGKLIVGVNAWWLIK